MTKHPKAMPNLQTLLLTAILLAFAATFSVFAAGGPAGAGQGPAQGPGPGDGPGMPAVNPAETVMLEGPVVSFVAGPGMGLPTLTVDDPVEGTTSVRLGPYRVLREAGFTAAAGDLVRITAYPCVLCTADYAAGTVENLTTGITVTLRDEDGTPVWLENQGPGHAQGPGDGPNAGPAGPGAGQASGPGAGPSSDPGAGPSYQPGWGQRTCLGMGPDVAAAVTVTGTVVAFTGGPGVGVPTLTLAVEGEELLLVAGPWRIWDDAGFFPQEGEELTVTYAPAERDAEIFLVILTVTDPVSGLTLVLRDPETGKPLGSRG